MKTQQNPEVFMTDIMLKHHVPPVRAYYDGVDLFVTPECLYSWATRLCAGKLYLNADNPERALRIVLKYAQRGFGFTTSSLVDEDIRLPEHIRHDLQGYSGTKFLPWYHPIYHPTLRKERYRGPAGGWSSIPAHGNETGQTTIL